jgi:hypothetical protein
LVDCYGSVLVRCCCEKLVAEERGQFENPEERERPPLEAVATGEDTAGWEDAVCAVVNCRVCEFPIEV